MVTVGDCVKLVYLEGNITDGAVRAIRGTVSHIDENSVTLKRRDGKITIGKSVLIKVENWRDNQRRGFDY